MANASCSISAPCCRQGWGMWRLAYIIAATSISRQQATHTNYLAPCRLAPIQTADCVYLVGHALCSLQLCGFSASRGMKHAEHKPAAPTNSFPLLVSPMFACLSFAEPHRTLFILYLLPINSFFSAAFR